MEEKSLYCENCRRNIPTGNFIIHSSYCDKNIQLCRLCNEPVPRSELEKHLDEDHKLDKCVFCKNVYEVWLMDSHQAECNKKPTLCKYCELTYPFDELSDHKSHCGSRTEKCAFCDNYVQLKEKDNHAGICQKNMRQKRMISCEYCSLEFADEIYEEHVLSCGSRTEECLCGAFVMIKNKRHHESTCKQKKDVKKRDVCCRYCGDGFHSDFLQNHEDNCDSRTEECYRCNEFVKFKDFDNHRKFCSKKKDVKRDVCCRYCGDGFHSDFLQNHEDNCDSHTEQCYRCNEFVKFKDFDNHRKFCSKKKDVKKRDVCCRYCGDGFHSDFLQNHEDNCESHTEQCYRCNEFVKFKDFDNHRKFCSKDNPKSVIDIEAEADYDNIECAEEANDGIPVLCAFCKVNFPLDCLQEHIETCGERTENCPICQKNITYKDKANHQITCKESDVDSDQICPICDVNFSSSDFKIHYEECFEANCVYFDKEQSSTEAYQSYKQEFMDCTESTGVSKDSQVSGTQFKSCPYCSKEIIERLYDNHVIYCPKALKMCPFCEETFHVKNEIMHVENCPSLEEMEFLKSHRDTNKSQYNSSKDDYYKKTERKYKTCLSCNAQIEETEYKEHIKIGCNNFKECKFCHSSFKVTNEINHLKKCPKIPRTTDKFLYEGLSADQASNNKKKMKEKELVICSICLNKIPKEKLKSHKDECVKSYQYCKFCYEKYHINKKQEHMKKCSKICHSKNSDTGAKPKTYGVSKLLSSMTRLFSGENALYQQERENFANGVDMNRRNVSPKIESQATSYMGTEFQSPQYLNQISCIPCEFCKRPFPFEEIVKHESGCRPDLVSLPPKANESLSCTKLTDESREGITKGMINEEQKYSSSKSSTKNQLDNETHLGNTSRTQENYSYMENFCEKYKESYTLPNKSIVSIYPTITGSTEKEESDYTMASAEKECLDFNTDRNKHKQYSQNNYSNDKNVPTELVSIENYSRSENSIKNYHKGNYLPEKYYAGTQENQNLHKGVKSSHNEMENAGKECLASNIDSKNYKEYSQSSYSDNKNVPTELVSMESYFYSENSNRKYKGSNFPEKGYNENIPQKNQNLHKHVKNMYDEISEKTETMNYLKMKDLVHLSENPQTKSMKEIAPNVTHEENVHLKQKYFCNEESKKYINNTNTFEASELFPAQNLSVNMTKSDECFAETKKIKKLKPSSDVSLHQIKKSEFSSTNEQNSSKSNESDKSGNFHIMWQKIDSETIEHLQSKSLKSSLGSCQKKLSASEVNILQQNASISGLTHSTVSCAKADDTLGKISNVTQNDIENLKSSELEWPMTKRKSVNDNFLDKSKFESTHKTKAYANLSVDDDNVELTSPKINDCYKIDELLLKRKQTQLVDSNKKYEHPYQDSLNLRNANFPYGLHNQSLINRTQKDESQNFHGIAETKSNFSLTIPDSSKIFLEKDENNRLNYNSSTKPLDQQMNDLSIKCMFEKKYDGIEQSEIKDNNLDNYLHFLDFDTSDRHKNEICSVCANEMCLCQIKESLNAEREKSQCFPEKSENRAGPMMDAKKESADVWNKWRESASDSE